MTWTDPIVEEIRQVRGAYVAKFNYDLAAICKDLEEQERQSGRQFAAPPELPSQIPISKTPSSPEQVHV